MSMMNVITKMLLEAKPLDNPIIKMLRDELPANASPLFLECQLVLKSGYAVAGTLTRTEGDVLRLVSIGKTADNKVMLADHYFTFDDVQTIIVPKPMPESVVQGVRRPLIVPGA